VTNAQSAGGAKLREAMARCNPAVARLRRRLLANPAYRRVLAKFTSCMRSHGVHNFPEPNVTGSGPLFSAAGLARTPQMRAAQLACIGLLRTTALGAK
jgi:hypothetical protein